MGGQASLKRILEAFDKGQKLRVILQLLISKRTTISNHHERHRSALIFAHIAFSLPLRAITGPGRVITLRS